MHSVAKINPTNIDLLQLDVGRNIWSIQECTSSYKSARRLALLLCLYKLRAYIYALFAPSPITQNHVCRVPRLCRVYFIGHSANTVFAECQIKYTRQTKTHGKIRLCRVFFSGTRQRSFLPCAFFLPSANHFFEAIFEALNEFK